MKIPELNLNTAKCLKQFSNLMSPSNAADTKPICEIKVVKLRRLEQGGNNKTLF